MAVEVWQQRNLFTGELEDTRSRRQKELDRERVQPQQLAMFSIGETFAFGVATRPWLNDAPRPPLTLEILDVRTPEDIAHDLEKEAQKLTTSLFAPNPPSIRTEQESEVAPSVLGFDVFGEPMPEEYANDERAEEVWSTPSLME